MIACKTAIVRGLVQGVGFRNATLREAARIGGLKGWVRNLDSGDVEVLVQGPPSAVEALIDWCRKGPGGVAFVKEVLIKESPIQPQLGEFNILI